MKALLAAATLWLTAGAALAAPHGSPAPAIPAQAAAVGYNTLTFSTTSFGASNVDTAGTYGAGFQWYPWNFFGGVTPSNSWTLNGDGSVSVQEVNSNGNAVLATAGKIASSPFYRGTAFGGGMYVEATLSFNMGAVNTANGWPAWWSMSLEHLDGDNGDQWPNQTAGYRHYMEADFMEADLGSSFSHSYDGNLHDWYGVYNVTCGAFCQVGLSNYSGAQHVKNTFNATDFTQSHKYGFLWVPATNTTSGSFKYYFDGQQIGSTISYSQYDGTVDAPPPTTSTPWTFGVIDGTHMVLILGAGTDVPLRVQSVKVWQSSAAGNLVN